MTQNDINKDALAIGSILDGEHYQYKIESILGQGSFGITYKASLILNGGLGNLRTAAAKVAIKEFFMSGVNGRDSSVNSAIYIGDSDVDIMTAKNSNLPCIGVSWGFRDKKDLIGANFVIDKPCDIINIIRSE